MTRTPFRLSVILAFQFVLLCIAAGNCHAQTTLKEEIFSTYCGAADLSLQPQNIAVIWQPMIDTALLIPPKGRCWMRLSAQNQRSDTNGSAYLILQRSPLIDTVLFDGQGKEITQSTHDRQSELAIEIGRRILFPTAALSNGPLYVRFNSSNPIFQERVINKGFSPLSVGVMEQQRLLMTTIFAAVVLLTSAMFIASFGIALRDLDFGIYSIYTFALGVTLIAWDQVDLPIVGINYGWVWQFGCPISEAMLCWLAIRFGKFDRHSIVVSRILKLVIAFNVLLLLWSMLAKIGVPVMPMPFDRFSYDNWQDVLIGALIMIGSWRGGRRGERDCYLLLLSLTPSMISDFINRIWDPAIAPFLQSSLGYALPHWLNKTIHFNGSLTWLALPMIFCFALARRSLLLHRSLIDERKLLEERVFDRTMELHSAMKELELLATTDSLTGLANRRSMNEWINHEIERSCRFHKPLALCMIDIDHFKNINDTFGHATGDLAIAAIAKTFNETIRKTDIASRYGGEEFLLLMPETDEIEASVVTERLREAIQALQLYSDDNHVFAVTASIGVAFFDHQAAEDTMSKLLNRVDKALYRAKNAGRNQVAFSSSQFSADAAFSN
ncbi:GGDEF domain-containing protein [Solimicrobium silvestre]|uniref:diguanylate cyclase n=1 Tax=Solimicrobium silvestre TaxID=2099400 RepID=A0A2S9GV77_9BURK|nr:GGDEF domain-containing protein [Solimicrobium silvestre]PRC91611.1 GGDEF: diguanylate cyclase (GGDEF) domain [Solimicrobium silvestre]